MVNRHKEQFLITFFDAYIPIHMNKYMSNVRWSNNPWYFGGGGGNINIICHFHWIECACFLLYYFFSFLAAVIFCKNVINLVTDTQNYNNNISDNLQNMRLHKKPITLSTINQHTVKTHIFLWCVLNTALPWDAYVVRLCVEIPPRQKGESCGWKGDTFVFFLPCSSNTVFRY